MKDNNKTVVLIDTAISKQGHPTSPSLEAALIHGVLREMNLNVVFFDISVMLYSVIINECLSEIPTILKMTRKFRLKLPEDYSINKICKEINEKGKKHVFNRVKFLYEKLFIKKDVHYNLNPSLLSEYNYLAEMILGCFCDFPEYIPKNSGLRRYIESIPKNFPKQIFLVYISELDPFTKWILKVLKCYSQMPVITMLHAYQGISTFAMVPALSTFKEVIMNEICDYIIYGEPEEIVVLLLNSLFNKQTLISNSIISKCNLPNTLSSTIVKKLDNLAFPDFSQISFDKYLSLNPIIPIEAARGCYWHRCIFCSLYQFHGLTAHYYSPKHINNVIKYLHGNYPKASFEFINNALPPKYLDKLSNILLKNNFKIQFTLQARFHPKLNNKIISKLSEAGCIEILWGLESGSKNILTIINKGISLRSVQNNLKTAAKANILNLVYVILGLPGETKKTIGQTLRFLVKNKQNIDIVLIRMLSMLKNNIAFLPYSNINIFKSKKQKFNSKLRPLNIREIQYYYNKIQHNMFFEKSIFNNQTSPAQFLSFAENHLIHLLNKKTLVFPNKISRNIIFSRNIYPFLLGNRISNSKMTPDLISIYKKYYMNILIQNSYDKEKYKVLLCDISNIANGGTAIFIMVKILVKKHTLKLVISTLNKLFKHGNLILFSKPIH